MKCFSVLFLGLIGLSSFASAQSECKMGAGVEPNCFQARVAPIIKITLVAYGSKMSTADLLRVEKLFKERFEASAESRIQLEVVDRAIVDLKPATRDFTDFAATIKGDDSHRSVERLTRLWYYYHSDPEMLVAEIHDVLKASGMAPALSESDFVIVLSGPQFEGLGYATGGYGVTEQPSEIAWGTSDGGSTLMNRDESLVDELLHEMGHLLGLDHASAKCFGDSMVGMQRYQCCQASPGSQDVMSYCRDRSRVQGPYYFRYTTCTRNYLLETTLPVLLQGGKRPFQKQPCE